MEDTQALREDVALLLDGLNEQQLHAVTVPFDRHVLVLAGAGCGKTAVLTRRIAFCARTFCDQHRILALTFTRKAAEEMKTRMVSLPGIDAARALPKLTTFHGFGLSVLRDTVGGVKNASRLGYTGEPSLLASDKRLEMLARLTSHDERLALGGDLLRLDDLLERVAVGSPRAEALSPDRRRLVDSILQRFSAQKRKENAWEFGDMIRSALELLRRFSDIAKHYGAFYKYVLVDEFQDTNPLQIELLKELVSQATSVFVVGDDDQAIYGFRGADTGPILDFAAHFEGAQVVKLETNYRSRPSILSAANRIFRDKPESVRKVLRSGRYGSTRDEAGVEPVKRRFATQQTLLDWIDCQAARLAREADMPLERQCVLFRLNETMNWSREYLESRGTRPLPRMQTVHGSKGLEFPVVYLCDLEESVFPHYRRRASARIRTWGDLFRRILRRRPARAVGCDIEEERRLFYVGVTRAEHRLFLLSTRSKQLGGRSVSLEPSRFLRLL